MPGEVLRACRPPRGTGLTQKKLLRMHRLGGPPLQRRAQNYLPRVIDPDETALVQFVAAESTRDHHNGEWNWPQSRSSANARRRFVVSPISPTSRVCQSERRHERRSRNSGLSKLGTRTERASTVRKNAKAAHHCPHRRSSRLGCRRALRCHRQPLATGSSV